MNLALFHHLPPGGGAPRVLAEFVRRRPNHDFTLYTRREDVEGLIRLDPRVEARTYPLPSVATRFDRLRLIAALPRLGRELAAVIDAGGHDAVFCLPSELVQAPEILPYLRTGHVYYAPEPLRSAYERVPGWRPQTLRERLTELRLDPYEERRRRLDRRNIRAAARVVTHSVFTQAALRRVYGVESVVVPLGVDAETFSPGANDRDDFVLSVGALHPLKGHDFVIRSIAAIEEPRPRLVVVADRGDLEPALRSLADELDVALEIRRGVSVPELVDLYRTAAVHACGQVREPFGLTTLEAMACATPVVAVAEGGFLETVRDGATGLLSPRDPDAFASSLKRIFDDARLAASLGDEGRREALTWTWERTAEGYDGLLEEAARSAA